MEQTLLYPQCIRTRRLGCWLVGMLLLASLQLRGAFTPPSALEEDGIRFELVGQGAFRWKRLVHAYDASLHAGEGSKREALLTGAPLRLEILYRREFSAADIISGGDALLKRNVSSEAWKLLQPRLAQLNRAYLDVKPGDRYTLTWVPEKGTTLRLNGKALVTVEGADFAAAYFLIWLGKEPISTSLRDQLLGDKKPSQP
jgi:hypothetical protein